MSDIDYFSSLGEQPKKQQGQEKRAVFDVRQSTQLRYLIIKVKNI